MVAKTIEELANEAAEYEDQTQDVGGGDFEFSLPEAGKTVGRLIEYIELGKNPQKPYMGKPKPDAEVIRITFELLSPTKNKKTYKDASGNDVVTYEQISILMTKKLNEKAKYRKLFNAMAYGRDIKHMAQMLGNDFLLEIFHNVSKKEGQPDKTYANLWNKDGVIGIYAPFIDDPIAGTRQRIPVPPATKPLKIFIFERPNKDTWDSLFIDGTKTEKNEKGEEVQVSKNWIQERILKATNFKGSTLDAMLSDIPELKAAMEANHAPINKPVEAPVEVAKPKTEEAPPFKADAPVLSELEVLKAKMAQLMAAEAEKAKLEAAGFVQGDAPAKLPEVPAAAPSQPATTAAPAKAQSALSAADDALAALGITL